MRTEDTFFIDMGSYRIRVTRKRVKNYNFRVGADGQPLMSIPLHASRADAECVAREHASWFERSLAKTSERATHIPSEWTTGDTINVWGEPTTIRLVRPNETYKPCDLVDGELLVRDDGSPAWRGANVEGWLQGELVTEIYQLLPRCEEAVGRKTTNITVRRMKTRWGSCTPSSGRIRMNTALAECPRACTETVLIHELCHLRVRDHGPEFKALMDLCCPDWRANQRWLDQHPPSTRDFRC